MAVLKAFKGIRPAKDKVKLVASKPYDVLNEVEAKAEAKDEFSKAGGEFRLWLGFLLPPAVWALQLQTVYLLTEYACATADFLPIHIVSLAALVLSLSGGFLSWRNWQKAGGQWNS